MPGKTQRGMLKCSFCDRSQSEAYLLIAQHPAYICEACVDLCVKLILDKEDKSPNETIEVFFTETRGYLKNRSNEFYELLLGELKSRTIYSIDGLAVREKSAFYLGPFTNPFNEIYREVIKPCLENLDFQVTRADEIFGTNPIMQDIWESIYSAQTIVADVTGRNPNVLYEVGISHAMGKPTILLTQDIDDVPFDLRHYRCVVYRDDAKGAKALERDLEATVAALSKVDPITSAGRQQKD